MTKKRKPAADGRTVRPLVLPPDAYIRHDGCLVRTIETYESSHDTFREIVLRTATAYDRRVISARSRQNEQVRRDSAAPERKP